MMMFAFLLQGDWVANLNTATLDLMQKNVNLFIGTGYQMARGIGTIALVIWATQRVLSGSWPFGEMISKILTLTTCSALLRFYAQPLVGGMSFIEILQFGPKWMTEQIGSSTHKQLIAFMDEYFKAHPPDPSVWSFLGAVGAANSQWILGGAIEILRGIMWAVTAWGLVGAAVCALIGPIFIPFLAWEPMEWMFWNWLKAMLHFSFYQVLAAAVIEVYSSLLLQLFPKYGGLALLPFLFLAGWGVLKTTSIAGALFGGGGGGGGLGTMLSKIVPGK